MAAVAALFAAITCTLLVLGVLWGLAHIFGEVAKDRIWRRRTTWQFSVRSMIVGVVAASVAFGLIRLGMEVFFPVVVGLVGVTAIVAVVRILLHALSPRSESTSASALREPSRPIGPPPADEMPAAHQLSENHSVRENREPRRKWWLKRYAEAWGRRYG